jgi:hypothetical protein
MLAAIWTDGDAAEIFFLIAAIVFAIEAVVILAARPQTARFTGLAAAVGLALTALGLLAL